MRVLKKISGVLTDITSEVGDYFNSSPSIALASSTDYLYIGQKLPFNHAYFKPGTANTTTTSVSVSIWDGNEWRSCAEVTDTTKASGKSLAQVGFISWVPTKNNPWAAEDTIDTEGNVLITGIDTITIYDLYWARLSFSSGLYSGTTLAWIGNVFSNDDDLGVEFPDLVTTATKTGNTFTSGYEALHVKAAEIIIQDLKKKNIIWYAGQILDREELRLASVQLVASLIFNAMGDTYSDQKVDARKEYLSRIDNVKFTLDYNQDAIENVEERFVRQGWLSR